MALQIKTAEKIKQYARICLWGTAKAGKTHGALALATALAGEGGKVGVISSEYGSSKLLANQFPHDIIDLAEVDERGNLAMNAFAPKRYEEALRLFIQNGYNVIVIDSLSHVWEGEGGLLEAVNKPGQNSFDDGWRVNTPIYKHLINTILAARCHIIITLRAKDAYVMEEYIKRNGEKGTRPKNVGQCPVMRKGFGYEMHLTLRVDDMVGYVEASAVQKYVPKGEQIADIGPELAYRLLDALDGVELPEPTPQQVEMRKLLDEFYALSPATYARIPNWEQIALRKALDLSDADICHQRTIPMTMCTAWPSTWHLSAMRRRSHAPHNSKHRKHHRLAGSLASPMEEIMSNRQQRRANHKKNDEKELISFTAEQWDQIVMAETCSGEPLRQKILEIASTGDRQAVVDYLRGKKIEIA